MENQVNNQSTNPHPNAVIIKAWADGQTVQWLVESKEPWWLDFQDNMHKCKPWIIDGTQWRIKSCYGE